MTKKKAASNSAKPARVIATSKTGLRESLIKAAPPKRNALDRVEVAGEVNAIIDEWIQGGEISAFYETKTSLARGIAKSLGLSMATVSRHIDKRIDNG